MFFSWPLERMKTSVLWRELQDPPNHSPCPSPLPRSTAPLESLTVLHGCYCRKRNKKEDNKYEQKTQRREEGSNKPQTKYSKGSGGKAAFESLIEVGGCRAIESC